MAHQFPPPPAYGNAYQNGQPYYNPFPGNGIHPNPYTPSPVHQSNHQFQSPYPPPSTNPQNFQMNTQLPHPNHPFPFPPPLFSRDMPKQFGGSTVPPPPPNFVHPPGTNFDPSQYNNNIQYSGLQYLQNLPLPSPNTINQTSGAPQASETPSHGQNDTQQLQDGLRLDGSTQNNGQGWNLSYAPSHGSNTNIGALPVASFSDLQQSDQISKRVDFPTTTTAPIQADQTPRDTAQHPSRSKTTVAPTINRTESSTSYRPPSPGKLVLPTTKDFLDNAPPNGIAAKAPSSESRQNQSLPELRELAKSALLSLLPHNIGYDAFVKEGIHGQILSSLYAELGVKVPAPDDEQPSLLDERSNGPAENVEQSSTKATGVDKSVRKSEPVIANKPTQPQDTTPPPVKSVGAAAGTAAGGLERKDRIALLLAARKGGSVKTPPLPSNGSTTEGKQSTALAGLSGPPVDGPRQAPSASQSQQAHQESSRVAEQPVKRIEISSSIPDPLLGPRTQNSKVDSGQRLIMPELKTKTASIQLTALTTPVREELVRTGFSSLIPGLFMSVDEAAGSKDTQIMDGLTDVPPAQITESPSVLKIDAVGHQLGQLSSAVSVSSRTKVDTVQQHTSKKRPVASDSFDSVSEPESKRSRSSARGRPTADIRQIESNGSASEGEIVEESEQVQHSHRESQPSTSATSKPGDTIPSESTKNAGHHIRMPSVAQELQKALDTNTLNVTTPAAVSGRGNGVLSPSPRPGPVRSISKLTPAQLTERAAALKAGLIRKNREKILQNGIPELETEINKTRTRVEALRVEESECGREATHFEAQAKLKRELEEKANMEADELEHRLRESIATFERFKEELRQMQSDNVYPLASRAVNTTPGLDESGPGSKSQIADGQNLTLGTQSEVITGNKVTDPTQTQIEATMNDRKIPESPSRVTTTEPQGQQSVTTSQFHGAELGSSGDSINSIDMVSNPSEVEDSDHIGEEDVEDEAETTQNEQEVTSQDYGPTSPDAQIESGYDSAMDVDGADDDSVSMSDSGSEQLMDEDEVVEEEEDEYEPEVDESYQVEEQEPSDEDEYEPADVDEYNPADPYVPEDYPAYQSARSTLSRRQSRASNRDVELGDISPDSQTNTASTMMEVTANGSQTLQSANSNDDKSKDSQPILINDETPVEVAAVSNQQKPDQESIEISEAVLQTQTQPETSDDRLEDIPNNHSNGPSHFVPYKTPLSNFKSFRFHPQFADYASNGYRSLTYSNDINSQDPLCPTELAGGNCTDPSCEEQHFRQMGLPDEKILVQMSSANDLKDKSERDRYVMGLKQVIAGLRQRGVKDFERVADALSEYRRAFLAQAALGWDV